MGRRGRQQLRDEGALKPLAVLFLAPATVVDEQPEDLGGHERMDDVRRVAPPKSRRKSARPGEDTCDLRLALLPMLCLAVEQGGGLGIGGRRADQDPLHRLGSGHDAAGDVRESGQLFPRVRVGGKSTYIRPVRQRHALVVSSDRDVQQFPENAELRGEQPVHRRRGDIRESADRLNGS